MEEAPKNLVQNPRTSDKLVKRIYWPATVAFRRLKWTPKPFGTSLEFPANVPRLVGKTDDRTDARLSEMSGTFRNAIDVQLSFYLCN